MKKKSIGLNAFLNSVRNILNIIFPIITFPYVSRILTVDGIGIYNFSSSIVGYFSLIAGLGISTYAIREGAKYRDEKTKITEFVDQVFTINICSTVVAYLLFFISLIVFNRLHNYVSCLLIFGLQIFFTTIGMEWFYQIYEDYEYITIRGIIFQIISVILLFIFVRKPNDYLNYSMITVFSTVGSNVLNFICIKKYVHIKLVWKFNWKKHLIPIFILFFASIANMIYINSDVTLLGIMKNNFVVGIYSVSAKVYEMVKTIISALLIVTVPRLSMLYGKKYIEKYKNLLGKLTNTLVTLTLPASVGLFMLSKEVVLIISGYKYLRAVSSLKILCLGYIFSILNWILSACVLIPAKREKELLKSMSASALVNIIINLLLIPYWDENAAAFSTVLAELCMLIVNYYYSKDIAKDVYISKRLLKTFVSSFVGCVGIVIICMLCDYGVKSLIIKTIFSVVFSVIMYAFLLLILKNEVAVNLFNIFKLKFHKKNL